MTKKLLFLPILLALAVSTIGVTMAFWSDTLMIDGTITTANFDSVWSIPLFPPWENEWKDVATITLEAIDFDLAEVTVTNAYPGYHAWVKFGLQHQSYLPAHVKSIEIVDPLPPEIQVWWEPFDGYDPWEEVQLHFLGEWFGKLHIEIIEDDLADPIIDPLQLHTYKFQIKIVMCQYNDPSQT